MFLYFWEKRIILVFLKKFLVISGIVMTMSLIWALNGSMLTHYRSIHEGIKYPCNHCDYQATGSDNLTTHIQSKHEGIKYPCDRCDYQATQKSNLTRHKKARHTKS